MRNRNILMLALLLFFLATSCSRSITVAEFKEYIDNPENGLSADFSVDNTIYHLAFLPIELVDQLLPGKELVFFEMKSENSESLFTLSEANFEVKVNGLDVPASIVIAENMGYSNHNRLIIGFSSDRVSSEEEMTFSFLDRGHRPLGQLNLTRQNLNELLKLKEKL